MKVKQFIKELQKLSQDALIVLAKDAEGNGFSPLFECSTEFYMPSSTSSGDLVENKEEGSEQAIVIWPID